MTRWLRVVALSVCLATGPTLVWAQDPDLGDLYLRRYRGPYRGQVIDADTKAPLVGAVVVALWQRHRVYPFQRLSENYAVREVVTNSEGRFLLGAKEVEEGGGRRLRFPEFLIFQPGFGLYPHRQRAPTGFTRGIFERDGTVVELVRLDDREERRKNLREISPHSLSEEPFRDLPQLMSRFNAERIAVGLNPYPPPEGR